MGQVLCETNPTPISTFFSLFCLQFRGWRSQSQPAPSSSSLLHRERWPYNRVWITRSKQTSAGICLRKGVLSCWTWQMAAGGPSSPTHSPIFLYLNGENWRIMTESQMLVFISFSNSTSTNNLETLDRGEK